MSEANCAQETNKRYKLRMSFRNVKSIIKFNIWRAFWRTLWFLHLGWQYSKLTCHLGIYRKFPDGRCQYCGVKHK
jgi:hypothetical protein